MAVQLKQRNFKVKSLTTGAIVIGAGLLLLKTFPHIKASLTGKSSGASPEEEDNEIVEVGVQEEEPEGPNSTSTILEKDLPLDPAEWSEVNLKSFLLEKEIGPPPDASHHELVSIVKSVQQAP